MGVIDKKFYRCYYNIRTRCEKEKSKNFKNYWWRWIKNEWHSFEQFKNDMYESYLKHCEEFWAKETTIERINVDLNYNKINCRWATIKEQAINRRNNAWSKFTVRQSFKNKIKVILKKKPIYIFWKSYKNLIEASNYLWITHQALSARINYWNKKHIWQYSLSWELLKIWFSLEHINKQLWYDKTSISSRLRLKMKYLKPYKWYNWKYIEDKNIIYNKIKFCQW